MKEWRLAMVRQRYRSDGGGEVFVSRALEALAQHNLDLNVITREWQGSCNSNWHIHICNPLKVSRLSRERGFAEAARSLWQKKLFDLVQSHERIPGCDIYRAGDGVHRRWLLQRARIMSEWRRKWLFSNKYHRYVMCSERAMYAAPELKAVICNAEMTKQEIIDDFDVAADKITVIYNAINNKEFIPADAEMRQVLRAQYRIPQQAHCLIFVGSGFKRKGLTCAIRALANTDSHLLVVGQDKAEKQYLAFVRSLGYSQRVHFMGVQKHILPFYQMADALLLPTLYDSFPNAVLEAMSCGLPVITTTTCGGSEFITPGQNGFITDALDIAGITEMIHALPRQALGSSMGAAARARIMSATPAYLSTQLIALYQRLLD
ncbi:Glycosyltransferase group 1 family protein [Serratia symbiotica]|nr:Glycosyltransferase group 1 family protein [Serratia symbiotica]